MAQSHDSGVKMYQSRGGSHTDHSFIQILGMLPVRVSELFQHQLQGCWIRPVQNEVLQEPGKIGV